MTIRCGIRAGPGGPGATTTGRSQAADGWQHCDRDCQCQPGLRLALTARLSGLPVAAAAATHHGGLRGLPVPGPVTPSRCGPTDAQTRRTPPDETRKTDRVITNISYRKGKMDYSLPCLCSTSTCRPRLAGGGGGRATPHRAVTGRPGGRDCGHCSMTKGRLSLSRVKRNGYGPGGTRRTQSGPRYLVPPPSGSPSWHDLTRGAWRPGLRPGPDFISVSFHAAESALSLSAQQVVRAGGPWPLAGAASTVRGPAAMHGVFQLGCFEWSP